MRAGLGGHEVLNLYAEAITRMPENPGIPPLFRDIFKNAFLPYRDPETLRAFLKIIDEFEYDHSERLGDSFESMLNKLTGQGSVQIVAKEKIAENGEYNLSGERYRAEMVRSSRYEMIPFEKVCTLGYGASLPKKNRIDGPSLTHAVGVPKLALERIKLLRFPFPPLETQQAIVAEIEAEQTLVSANQELIARMEEKIQAAIERVWGKPEAETTRN